MMEMIRQLSIPFLILAVIAFCVITWRSLSRIDREDAALLDGEKKDR